MAYMDRALNRRKSQADIDSELYVLVDRGRTLTEHPVESTDNLGEAILAASDQFGNLPFAIYKMTNEEGGSRRMYESGSW